MKLSIRDRHLQIATEIERGSILAVIACAGGSGAVCDVCTWERVSTDWSTPDSVAGDYITVSKVCFVAESFWEDSRFVGAVLLLLGMVARGLGGHSLGVRECLDSGEI